MATAVHSPGHPIVAGIGVVHLEVAASMSWFGQHQTLGDLKMICGNKQNGLTQLCLGADTTCRPYLETDQLAAHGYEGNTLRSC